jgi:RNA polymerase sigma-70 factor (ECF subfamily)
VGAVRGLSRCGPFRSATTLPVEAGVELFQGSSGVAAVSKVVQGAREGVVATAEMALPTDAACAVSDAGLVARCRAGDTQAFGRLVELHEGMVINLSARLLGDIEEARDVAQEVFLQIYRSLHRFEGRSSLKTWIYRIVVNHCRNRQRWWRRRHRAQSVAIEDLSPGDEARASLKATSEEGPFERYARREMGEKVARALSGLSFEHRTVLMLREVEDLSCEEIAETLGLPNGTVKSRLSRARESLRLGLLPLLGERGQP